MISFSDFVRQLDVQSKGRWTQFLYFTEKSGLTGFDAICAIGADLRAIHFTSPYRPSSFPIRPLSERHHWTMTANKKSAWSRRNLLFGRRWFLLNPRYSVASNCSDAA